MLKILFVDDDAIARRSIAAKLDWTAYGWELVHTAKNAVDALDFMKQTQPDIVLSDIKMPVMDGIQMAVIARNYYPDIKFIFLSGYKEFTYAKQALRLNAVDYLDKPIDAEHLISVLKEAEALCRQDREKNRILRDKYPSMRRHMLTQLMQKHFRGTGDSIFQALDLQLTGGFAAAGFVEVPGISSHMLSVSSSAMEQLCMHLSRNFSGSVFLANCSWALDNGINEFKKACADVTNTDAAASHIPSLSRPENLQSFFIFTACEADSEDAFGHSLSHFEACAQKLWQSAAPSAPALRFYYGIPVQNLNELYLSYESILQTLQQDTANLLEQVKNYLQKNYADEDLTLTQIADHFYLNHCYLTSIFKERFGINLYDYLIQTRMQKAGELALSSDKKVYEIAAAAGYKNSQYFSVSFKKYYGCTVMEYRQRNCRERKPD